MKFSAKQQFPKHSGEHCDGASEAKQSETVVIHAMMRRDYAESAGVCTVLCHHIALCK